MNKFLIIQTAFTGDVVLATALIEKLHAAIPAAQIDFLVRKGNEGLLQHHPLIRNLLVWNKKTRKLPHLFSIAMEVRCNQYDYVINVHRFASSGLVTLLSGATHRIGFSKNPLSMFYTRKVAHIISQPGDKNFIHETERNQRLISDIAGANPALPKLYPTLADVNAVAQYKTLPYVCIAPASVWFTKQFPTAKWAALIDALPATLQILVIGGPDDRPLAGDILSLTNNTKTQNLCGKLTFLQSAALMADAAMNYTNDSAPLHFASAMNAPVTAVFCSTVPEFGFGPLTESGKTVETTMNLPCKPCGLHGKKECPEKHFKCAQEINNEQLLWWTLNKT